MSRKKRVLQKRFVIFCEGNTEYNYIDKMRKKQGELEAFKKLLEYCRIQNAKGNTDIYNYLNSGELSYQTMLDTLCGKEKLLFNKYEIRKKNFETTIKETLFNMDLFRKKSSNIEEFFDVIDW